MAVVGLAISVLAADALRARQAPYDLQALRGEIDTGFRPGRDDWQFPNDGSTLCYQVEGHDVGMLLTERWYYGAKPDGDAVHLYDRYNNNGADKTAIWEDDRTALRLVSVVEADLETMPAVVTPEVVAARQTPKDVWRDVASAMLQTGEPQILTALEVTGDDRQIVAAKHLLVYRISDAKLYVADPVYPGRERLPVELTADGRFQPYVSKSKASDEQAAQYNTMMPFRIGPLTRERIPQRWQQFKAGGLGEKEFQPYTLMTENAVGARYRLADGDTYATPSVTVLARTQDLAFGLRVFRDGAWVNEDTDKPVTIELRPGRNVIGLKVSLPAVNGKWAWHDFKYVTLNSTACDFRITPARQYCVVGQRCPLLFAMSTQLPLDGLAIDWHVDSALRRSDGPREMDYVAPSEEGPHYIKAALRSKETGRVVCEAEAMANVQPKPAPVAAKEPPKAVETSPDRAAPLEPGREKPDFWAAVRECDKISVELELQG
jgi:hypothetical protein